MKNMKIRVKLILSFMITVALAVVIGVVGIVSLATAADNTALLNDRTTMAIQSARTGRNVQQQRAAYRGAAAYYLTDMTEEMEASLADMTSLDNDYKSTIADLGNSLTTEEGKRMLREIETSYASFSSARDAFVTAMRDPNTDNNEMMVKLGDLTAPVGDLVDDVTTLTDFISDLTDEQALQAATTAATTTVTMIIIIVIAVVASVALSLYISNMISKPIAVMQGILVQVGETGSMEFTEEVMASARKEASYKDEIAQSLKAFTTMMDRLRYIAVRLNEVAGGDLTADINLLSPQDDMGNALKNMSDNLNNMFAEISSVGQQVSTASGEIATGAQSLAQGSTEQASTVEEISASINEITEQANVSVATASDAAKESQNIRNIAQDGNEKMGRLSTAVQEMSEASQSIGNVIKVIDDIAFQTNILALNAAVEAARAGEHGKGFAVVADEVRNLAGKSAEAAKETSGLISANIEKSELGLTISQETAETLHKIVEGVEHTTEQLNTIAQQSEASKAATEQVNLAVDQVAQVVQQNSATSEESAAASEEMSSQAQVLQQLIGRFKLKDTERTSRGGASSMGGGSQHQLPPASHAPVSSGGDIIF